MLWLNIATFALKLATLWLNARSLSLKESISSSAGQPSPEEIQSALPAGVKLVSYEPKQAPFTVAPGRVVTNAGKFFRVYLKILCWWLEHPDGYAAPPLTASLSKLPDAGLELRLGHP
jgi:hypothetical protein